LPGILPTQVGRAYGSKGELLSLTQPEDA